jgi:hypothetical protein
MQAYILYEVGIEKEIRRTSTEIIKTTVICTYVYIWWLLI